MEISKIFEPTTFLVYSAIVRFYRMNETHTYELELEEFVKEHARTYFHKVPALSTIQQRIRVLQKSRLIETYGGEKRQGKSRKYILPVIDEDVIQFYYHHLFLYDDPEEMLSDNYMKAHYARYIMLLFDTEKEKVKRLLQGMEPEIKQKVLKAMKEGRYSTILEIN
ncbi:MAG: hypothetical protein ABII71_05305 [Candidatus Micrarchaeota archaeon]